jgi:hypothetical protein
MQPVILFTLDDKWNLISRTIVPAIQQDNCLGNSSQSGLGDTTVSLFFSPKKPGPGGLIWNIGPDVYLPTATDALLGAGKWGVGPTAVVLRQDKGWTYGALVHHIWSFAGDDSRKDISNTFLQPILSYQTKANTTI